MKNKYIVFSLTLLFTLTLAGCSWGSDKNAVENTPNRENTNQNKNEQISDETSMPTDIPEKEENVDSLTLEGEAEGNNMVSLRWKVPNEMKTDVEKYMIVRGSEENPTYPSSWYWWRGPAHTDHLWEELPAGESHFRVCAMKGEECLAYSNNLMLEIR